MNNFGVVEVASQRRTMAPGWAYVADNSNNSNVPAGLAAAMAAANSAAAASAAKNPRKRAARSKAGAAGGSLALFSDLTSRQETKLRKELELLDRDGGSAAGAAGGGRDGAIPIPAKALKAQNKYTPNVRKILASQKTFANHLDDFNALSAQHESNHGHGHGATETATGGRDGRGAAAAAASSGKGGSTSSSRRPTKKDAKQKAGSTAAARRSASAATPATPATPTPADTPMPDAPDAAKTAEEQTVQGNAQPTSAILLPYAGPRPTPHPLDGDPLLISGMPPLPTDDELRALVAAPPLTYAEARATWQPRPVAPERRYPTRVFCEICGYWGRVKCTKCGTPVCALDCLELHREECITRYGL